MTMKRMARVGVAMVALAAATGAWAQFGGLGPQCASLVSTTQLPAPATGSFEIRNLDKYGVPAQACTTIGSFSMSGMSYSMTTAAATVFNNATLPSCQGMVFTVNGGPIYSYSSGSGTVQMSGTGVTGTINNTALTQTDNLQVSLNGQTLVVNTGVLEFRSTTTLNADGSSDTVICTPSAGVAATLNGNPFNVPPAVWQCLAQPNGTSTNRVRYQAC